MKADGLESRPMLHLDSSCGAAEVRPQGCRMGSAAVSSPLQAPFLKCLTNDFSLILELYIDSVVVIILKANRSTGFFGLYSVWLAYLIST